MTIKLLAMAAASLLVSAAVWAHHSAAQFDFSQSVEIEGVVKELRVANPHVHLVMEVTDEKGSRDIVYEGHSRNNVYRRGWRPNLVEIGDTITIGIAPTRSGEDGGYVQFFRLDDGTEF